jgi:membrane protease YdiL (CAAX protease family)
VRPAASEARCAEAPALGSTLALVAAIWAGLFAAQSLAAAALGEQGAASLSFAFATAVVVACRGRWRRRAAPRDVVLLAVGAVAGLASFGGWLLLAWRVGTALGLDPGPASPWRPGTNEVLCFVLVAPVFEELLYRERLLAALVPRTGRLPALLLTSGLFAAPHLEAPDALRAFGAGLGLGAVLLASRSVAPCIGLHAGLNLAALAGRA